MPWRTVSSEEKRQTSKVGGGPGDPAGSPTVDRASWERRGAMGMRRSSIQGPGAGDRTTPHSLFA